MKITLQTKYLKRSEYYLRFMGNFADGGAALELYSTDAQREMRCTVSIGEPPKPGHVWVKDWSENEGLLPGLIEAGVLHPTPTRVARSGFVDVFEHKLTDAALQHLGVLA